LGKVTVENILFKLIFHMLKGDRNSFNKNTAYALLNQSGRKLLFAKTINSKEKPRLLIRCPPAGFRRPDPLPIVRKIPD
jgi:hypothetical protein